MSFVGLPVCQRCHAKMSEFSANCESMFEMVWFKIRATWRIRNSFLKDSNYFSLSYRTVWHIIFYCNFIDERGRYIFFSIKRKKKGKEKTVCSICIWVNFSLTKICQPIRGKISVIKSIDDKSHRILSEFHSSKFLPRLRSYMYVFMYMYIFYQHIIYIYCIYTTSKCLHITTRAYIAFR